MPSTPPQDAVTCSGLAMSTCREASSLPCGSEARKSASSGRPPGRRGSRRRTRRRPWSRRRPCTASRWPAPPWRAARAGCSSARGLRRAGSVPRARCCAAAPGARPRRRPRHAPATAAKTPGRPPSRPGRGATTRCRVPPQHAAHETAAAQVPDQRRRRAAEEGTRAVRPGGRPAPTTRRPSAPRPRARTATRPRAWPADASRRTPRGRPPAGRPPCRARRSASTRASASRRLAARTAPPSGRTPDSRATRYPVTSEPAATGAVGTGMPSTVGPSRHPVGHALRLLRHLAGETPAPIVHADEDHRRVPGRPPALPWPRPARPARARRDAPGPSRGGRRAVLRSGRRRSASRSRRRWRLRARSSR